MPQSGVLAQRIFGLDVRGLLPLFVAVAARLARAGSQAGVRARLMRSSSAVIRAIAASRTAASRSASSGL